MNQCFKDRYQDPCSVKVFFQVILGVIRNLISARVGHFHPYFVYLWLGAWVFSKKSCFFFSPPCSVLADSETAGYINNLSLKS